jgi:PLP dependent protein
MSTQESFYLSTLATIQQRIASACHRSGRSPSEIKIVPVSKYVDAQTIELLTHYGLDLFAEARVQDLKVKQAFFNEKNHPLKWHFIGHLQTNKVKDLVGAVDVIQSVDSEKLLDTINQRAELLGTQQAILLQVNVEDDPAKFGFKINEITSIVDDFERKYPNTTLSGLMTIGKNGVSDTERRTGFRVLKDIRERLLKPEAELSMGMSDDFEQAIEEGATIVRLGRILFSAY